MSWIWLRVLLASLTLMLTIEAPVPVEEPVRTAQEEAALVERMEATQDIRECISLGAELELDMIDLDRFDVTAEEMEQLDHSVKDFEPHLALYGGEDGLDFYRSIAQNFRDALKPGGYLCFEFGKDQGNAVCEILEKNGYTILERTRDYNERERAVIAQYGRKEEHYGD